MKEEFKRSISDFLASDAVRRQGVDALVEEVTGILVVQATARRGEYEADRLALLPEAQSKLTSVIKPWWQEFIGSGIYQQIYDWVNREDKGVIGASELIVFPWLRTSTKPEQLRNLAEYLVKDSKDAERAKSRAETDIEPFTSGRPIWRAHFFIAGERQFRHDKGFGVERWPMNGGGIAYAMNSRHNDVMLNLDQADQLVERLHPEILIGFANQIESGRMEEVLQRSMETNPRVSIDKDAGAKRLAAFANEYWQRKGVL